MFVRGCSTVYTRDQLLSLRRRSSLLPVTIVDRVRSLSLRRSRGVRGGRNKPRPIRTICMTSDDRRPSVKCKQIRLFTSVTADRVLRDCSSRTVPDTTLQLVSSLPRPRSSLVKVHIDRHSAPPSQPLVCGSLNVRSLTNKVDNLLDVRRDQLIDVLFLTETWHDVDSICLRRLRTDGFQVVDRPRPRVCTDTLMTNHGGDCGRG